MITSTRALFPEQEVDHVLSSASFTICMPASVHAYLREQANACGMNVSAFVTFMLAFYREHMEEVRSLCQPWPPRASDIKERVELPQAVMKRHPMRKRKHTSTRR